MSVYITSLFIAIPIFITLILIEILVARSRGIRINRHEDMISSLSSGMTHTVQSAMKFSIVIISYSWLVEHITIFTLKPLWLAVLVAFIIEDFAGYWMHRLTHRVNIFWNRHVIHHSSEEFNLSCALRQSISTTFRFSAVLMIPAALMGVPPYVFAVLGPIHLFMQFWYHTTLISKMGILEHIIVTPSHHRVHHAINPEYIDKNYSQIFIIWDKLFNTFQIELEGIDPVYGTLRPAGTWNPIRISYKHIFQIAKDAYQTQKIRDKIRIWFMPTGWRPDDVKKQYPLDEITNPANQMKYNTKSSNSLIIWAWLQHILAGGMMFHIFIISGTYDGMFIYAYALILFAHIFSFTSLLDHRWHVVPSEIIKLLLVFYIMVSLGYSWFNLGDVYSLFIIGFFLLSSIGSLLLIRAQIKIG